MFLALLWDAICLNWTMTGRQICILITLESIPSKTRLKFSRVDVGSGEEGLIIQDDQTNDEIPGLLELASEYESEGLEATETGHSEDEDLFPEGAQDPESPWSFQGNIFEELQQNKHQPYCPGLAQIGVQCPTPLQEAYFNCRLKQLKKISDEAADTAFKRDFEKFKTAQGDCYLPRSLHLAKKLLGVQKAKDIERHVCINDCHLFPQTVSADPEVECCPICHSKRFKVLQNGGRIRLRPQKVFWDFGAAKQIQQLFKNKDWCKLRRLGIANSQSNPLDFRASPEFERLQAATENCLSNPDNGLYDVGFDFGHMFQFKRHSCGFLGIR